MRILLLPSSYHPHKGGVEEVVRQLAHAYRRMGHRVLIVAPLWPHDLPTSETVEDHIVQRVAMPLPSTHARSMGSFLLRFPAAVVRTLYIGWRWRPDVVQAHCVGPNGLYALVLHRVLRIPLVVTSHGEQTIDAGKVYERSAAQRWVLRALLGEADVVTACSADALNNLRPYGSVNQDHPILSAAHEEPPSPGPLPPAVSVGRAGDIPAMVIPNGVDPDEFSGPLSASPHTRPYIFAIGRHVWNKGFDVLLRAYAPLSRRYPGVDLVIAGDGPEHGPLVDLTRELGIADRVMFPGRTDRAATTTYFRHALFFVLPSLQEAFGIVNLEAMAAGKAVIATRVGGVPDVVHDGQNGLLVPPSDASALGGAIESLLRDRGDAHRLGAAGARLVGERYTWGRIAAVYVAVCRHAIANARAHGQGQGQGPSRDLLCIGQKDWDEVWNVNQFLLAGLAQGGVTRRTLYVEPACDVTYGLRAREFFRARSRQRMRLQAALRGARPSSHAPGLWLFTPFKLLPNSIPALRTVNEWLERAQVKAAARGLRMKRPLFWTQNPESAHWLTHVDAALTIYHATDDWSLMVSPRRWVDVVRRGQEELARRAQLVFTSSPTLQAKWSAVNPDTHPLPNGVDVAHFARVGHAPPPEDIARLPHPILGYTGTVQEERVDVELVYRVAAARPDWTLVFVGPNYLKSAALDRLSGLPNVRLLGPRPYGGLPAYMSAFDVCIIPHCVTPFTESLDPIKIYEYLATGLPIVSTPVARVRDFADAVYLARDAVGFIRQVEAALGEDSSPEQSGLLKKRRRALAEDNSWADRVTTTRRLIADRLASIGDGGGHGHSGHEPAPVEETVGGVGGDA